MTSSSPSRDSGLGVRHSAKSKQHVYKCPSSYSSIQSPNINIHFYRSNCLQPTRSHSIPLSTSQFPKNKSSNPHRKPIQIQNVFPNLTPPPRSHPPHQSRRTPPNHPPPNPNPTSTRSPHRSQIHRSQSNRLLPARYRLPPLNPLPHSPRLRHRRHRPLSRLLRAC